MVGKKIEAGKMDLSKRLIPPIELHEVSDGCLQGRDLQDFSANNYLVQNTFGLNGDQYCFGAQQKSGNLSIVTQRRNLSSTNGPYLASVTLFYLDFAVPPTRNGSGLRKSWEDFCAFRRFRGERLNSVRFGTMYVMGKTTSGTLVADESMTFFYSVLGIERSFVNDILPKGKRLPMKTKISAIPFRGALVFSGVASNACEVSEAEESLLEKSYLRAKRSGQIITGYHEQYIFEKGLWNGIHRVLREWFHILGMLVMEYSPFFIVLLVGIIAESICIWKRQIHELVTRLSKYRICNPCICSTSWLGLLTKLIRVRTMKGDVEIQNFELKKSNNRAYISAFVHENKILGTFKSEQIKPTAMEIVLAFSVLSEQWRPLPSTLYINDHMSMFVVRAILKIAGIKVLFYPEPCAEEREFITMIDEGLLRNEDYKLI